jgi:hypothetical protein
MTSEEAKEANREACRRYREKNRALINAKALARRNANPELARARNRASMNAAAKARPEEFRQKWREKNRKAYAENPMKVKAKNKAYALRKQLPAWADKFLIEEMYALARMRSQLTSEKWEVDHIVPLQSPLVCGLHTEHNLRVVVQTVNRRKGNLSWPGHPDPEKDIALERSFFS